jgi:hypothetical protein
LTDTLRYLTTFTFSTGSERISLFPELSLVDNSVSLADVTRLDSGGESVLVVAVKNGTDDCFIHSDFMGGC